MSHAVNGFVSRAERTAYLEHLLSGRLPARPAMEVLLERLMNPAVRGPFLEALLRQPLHEVRELVENLAGGDTRAAIVLSPLLHAVEESIVLLTISALRDVGSPAARPPLAERASFDPRPQVRRAAEQALLALPDEPAPALESPQLPLYAAYLTVVDGAGGQMALVARSWDEDEIAIFHVIFDDSQGIVESFGFPSVPPLELTDTLDDLEDDGLTPAEVPLAEISSAVEAAYHQSLAQRGRAPAPFAAWQTFLAGDDPRDLPPVQLPEVRLPADLDTFSDCHHLLDLEEFGTWYFESAEIGPAIDRLQKLQHRRGEPDYDRRLVNLIRQTLAGHITPDRQHLFRRRLERQAPLLMRIYDDPIHARRTVAAAAGLADEAGIPASEHPLLQEMLVRSLEEALGRPLVDRPKGR